MLFLADRKELVKQAKDAFYKYIENTTMCNLLLNKDERNAKIIFSTYQTMLHAIDTIKNADGSRFFSPGHFSLIVIDEAHRSIFNKYKAILEPFLKRMPDKTFHYVASYMLKGYAMEKNGIAEKYGATSYKSLKRKIPSLLDILDNAYGKSYCQISNPTLVNNEVDLGITNANKGKSRAITHSFGMKLRALVQGEEVEITFCDVQGTKKIYKFTEVERMSFVLFGILYASRCNNFHGNVAARMNSINANKDTFKMYTDMFLTEYIILAIHLNSQGVLSDVVLNKVKENVDLMI